MESQQFFGSQCFQSVADFPQEECWNMRFWRVHWRLTNIFCFSSFKLNFQLFFQIELSAGETDKGFPSSFTQCGEMGRLSARSSKKIRFSFSAIFALIKKMSKLVCLNFSFRTNYFHLNMMIHISGTMKCGPNLYISYIL